MMRKKDVCGILLGMLMVLPPMVTAQYWGERVQEKGFEQTDFFFVPSNLNPYGIGTFKSTTPGLLSDPLLSLAVNPASVRIDSLSAGYFYTDFRSARTIRDQGYSYAPMPWLAYASSDRMFAPYPWIYVNARQELEPVFSGAYIGRPLPQAVPNLLLGASYQLMLQDDKYYSVPQDIYRSVIGQDYAGNKAAAASSIPVVDRYSGQDNIHQKGHFVAAFGKYEVPTIGSAGIKVGRAFFDRSGSFGSSNFWGSPAQPVGTSLWSNLEARSQTYDHWELTGGAEIFLNEQTTIGATAGWMWGDAAQALHRNDSSYYNYSSAPNHSLYVRSGNTLEEWRHDGRTALLGLDVISRFTPKQTLHLWYQRQRTTVDIGLGASIFDTSYSTYSYTYLDTPATSSSYSVLRDQRAGAGRRVTTTSKALASLQWQIDDRVKLSLGAQLDWYTSETNTNESVLARMGSSYTSTQGMYKWMYGNDESKDLAWTFSARKTVIQIPIFLTLKTSDAIEVLLGLNRAMTSTKIDDVTLALFRYRVSNSGGTVTRQENFGERYTTPTEEISDVRTTFLAGLTAAPSRQFRVRLLMVPNFRDTYDGSELEQLQWWIGVTLLP